MVLDLLLYKHPQVERNPWGWLRYVTFALSLLFVGRCLYSRRRARRGSCILCMECVDGCPKQAIKL